MGRAAARPARSALPISLVRIFRRHLPSLSRLLVACCAVITCSLGPAAAQEPPAERKIPSFAELEAAGAVIGEISINNQNIFDMGDEKENNVLYRAANAIHIRTRAGLIESKLLFKQGERVSVRLIEETERLLRTYRFVYDVSIAPVAYHDGVVDIEVKTRDTWTLAPTVSFGRAGGVNTHSSSLSEFNALGTGVFAGASRTSNADRTGVEYRITDPHAFDGWTVIDAAVDQNSDGGARMLSLTRPFYALETRWAAGLTASTDNRIDSVFTNGTITSQFRHRQDKAEAFGGWSEGLVEGWAHRYSLGVTYEKDSYNLEPGLAPPPQLPADQTLTAPFLRYEVVQDSFDKVKNRDLIERPEFFAMGWQSSLQLGRALTGLGSTQDSWLYTGSASDGFRLPAGQILLTSASIDGQSGYSPLERQLLSGSVRYYSRPQGNTLLFASVSGDTLRDANSSDQLLLGGDTGLRGYPRGYQSGDRRALFTVEERVYTDWYPFRLFRVGGAVFYDEGRAWGGPTENAANAGWLRDVGFGLRILSARAAFGNVLHLDLAFPLNRDPNIKSVQFLVVTKLTL